MPDIKNLGYGSLAIQLSDDKQITLGPRETKEISNKDLESEGVQKTLRDGLATILTSGEEKPEKKPKPKNDSN